MPSSYHIKKKTFIEASCTDKIHTGEKDFSCCLFHSFVGRFFSDNLKKPVAYVGLFEYYLRF